MFSCVWVRIRKATILQLIKQSISVERDCDTGKGFSGGGARKYQTNFVIFGSIQSSRKWGKAFSIVL